MEWGLVRRQTVLLLCTVLLAACVPVRCSGAVRIAYTATGTSALAPASMPLPPGSM